MRVHGREIRGVDVDAETRCAHYGGERDVVAIEAPCCGTYYPCFRCHEAAADHDLARWPADAREARAVLCGVCGAELQIREYLDVDACPSCGTAFNPGCADHYHLYFAGIGGPRGR